MTVIIDCFIPVSYCNNFTCQTCLADGDARALVLISPSLVGAVLYTFVTLLPSGNRVELGGVKTDGQIFRVHHDIDTGSKAQRQRLVFVVVLQYAWLKFQPLCLMTSSFVPWLGVRV